MNSHPSLDPIFCELSASATVMAFIAILAALATTCAIAAFDLWC